MVCLQVVISLCYCYAIGKIVPKGFCRLFALIPIIWLFLTLPLVVHNIHLCGIFNFFISWLANFKLVLFAFGKGPLSNPSLSLKQFVFVASFPMKIYNKQTTSNFEKSPIKTSNKGHKPMWNYIIKGAAFIALIGVFAYLDIYNLDPIAKYSLYCLYIYLLLEVSLFIIALFAQNILGFELEPHFDEPYLASSLQDFWSRRWNLVVVNILRLTIYEPYKLFASRFIDPYWATISGIFLTFVVSGLMHELLFYHLGRVRPTWEITWFFLLHGFCVLLEVFLKKKFLIKFQLPRAVSTLITLGFVIITAFWLFFPQFIRCNVEQRAFEDYAKLGLFLKNVTRKLMLEFKAFNYF